MVVTTADLIRYLETLLVTFSNTSGTCVFNAAMSQKRACIGLHPLDGCTSYLFSYRQDLFSTDLDHG